jgi:hypothetical protein
MIMLTAATNRTVISRSDSSLPLNKTYAPISATIPAKIEESIEKKTKYSVGLNRFAKIRSVTCQTTLPSSETPITKRNNPKL